MPGTLTLLKLFATGQGLGIGIYADFASDHDINYTDVEDWALQVKTELDALSGAGAALIFDMLQSTSPAVTDGRVGDHSYKATLITADTQVRIDVGKILFAGDALILPTIATFTGSGGAGSRFIALQVDGSVTQETSAAQGVSDLYELDWLGAVFDTGFGVGGIQDNTDVFPDGDDFQDMLSVVGNASAGPPAESHLKIANRLENIEAILRGDTTNITGGVDLGPLAFGGAVGAVGLCLGDGTTFETDTGWYREGVDLGSYAVGGAKALGIDAVGNLDLPLNMRVRTRQVAGFTVSQPNLTNVDMDTEVFDVGGMWAIGSPDQHVIPTDGDGIYIVCATVVFDESTAAAGGAVNGGNQRTAQLTINASVTGSPGQTSPTFVGGSSDPTLTLSAILSLSATDVIRVMAAHDNGGDMDVLAQVSMCKIA